MGVCEVSLEVVPRFENYVLDWNYPTYLLVGGYGSSKSYHTAQKIIIKCFEEKRKVLVVREVKETHKESTFDLFKEILEGMDLLTDDRSNRRDRNKVTYSVSPMNFTFPNGSKIIFRGMDSPQKLKSINGISLVWLEEASEIKYEGYKELLGRLRAKDVSMHIILTTNPVGMENWVYQHFFKRIDEDGKELVVLDDERLYNKRTIVKNGVYYHHSTPDDNPHLPKQYIKSLDEMKEYDEDLYRVARLGRFGVNGRRVLPQFEVATNAKEFKRMVKSIPRNLHFRGLDFGFETSYNALIWCAVDDKNKTLYIYKEYYKNGMTDDEMVEDLNRLYPMLKDDIIIADNEDPKAIRYMKQCGYRKVRGCRKFAGSRLSNTRKMKRFKRIVCSPTCVNTIRELQHLTYKVDRNGQMIFDEFNIDPHTFSALWYALENYTVADIKGRQTNSRKGA